MAERWDIFCRVVDNFGDAGVCWRLARQLVHEHRLQVRLWIDDLASLARLEPAVSIVPRQCVGGVEVLLWDASMGAESKAKPALVVIEAFGCGLPDRYVAAMAACPRPPVWIVLEYLSAEAWVREHHALPSPHPRLPLARHFFFPGFEQGTGGLLRERDLVDRRDAYDGACRRAFWHSVGHEPVPDEATAVSVFAYESAPLGALLQVWAGGASKVVVAVPEGRALGAALAHFRVKRAPSGGVLRQGALEVRVLPFVPQVRYDELLWSCDLNFVRGEDSFVRAQWAARPLVWHIYPQEDRAHWHKLDAFLDRYTEALPSPAASAAARLMRFWNSTESLPAQAVWTGYLRERAVLADHARAWATQLAAIGGLADHLARFCQDKLK